jgi:hypothetical protein
MRLEINPISRLADETLLAKMIDGPQESEMTITVAVTDTRDHHWESRNVFRTGVSGTVDVSRDAPVSGSYVYVDPVGPTWSKRFASEDVAPSMFAAPGTSCSSLSLLRQEVRSRAGLRFVVGVGPA